MVKSGQNVGIKRQNVLERHEMNSTGEEMRRAAREHKTVRRGHQSAGDGQQREDYSIEQVAEVRDRASRIRVGKDRQNASRKKAEAKAGRKRAVFVAGCRGQHKRAGG
jgi:hypothetical protein